MPKNDLVAWPDDWPEYRNACSDPCDMLSGPCACGAWHKLYEWDFERKTRKPTEAIIETRHQELAKQKLLG